MAFFFFFKHTYFDAEFSFVEHHQRFLLDINNGLAITKIDGKQSTSLFWASNVAYIVLIYYCFPRNAGVTTLPAEICRYFEKSRTEWAMCLALTYHSAACAVIVLQKNQFVDQALATKWTEEDLDQLEEISAQGKEEIKFKFYHLCSILYIYTAEVGLAHAHLLEEAEKGRRLTDQNIALSQAKAAAEAGSRAKSQFLAIVSHEIRYRTVSLKDRQMSNIDLVFF